MSITESNTQAETTTKPEGSVAPETNAAASEAPAPEVKADEADAKSEAVAGETAPEGKGVVPEKYDLKIPEGSLLEAGHLEQVSLFAKEKGLSNEQAQAVLEREHEAISQFVQKQTEEFKAKSSEWLEAVKSDKELGGDRYNETAEYSKRVIDRFADQELKSILDETGYGNHPALVRIFSRIGKAMSSDKFVNPGHGGQTRRAPEDVLFGSNN